MSKTQSNNQPSNDGGPLGTRSTLEVKVSPDDANRMVRYRDNLRLIPESLEYDERGRLLRQELNRVDEYLWRYKMGMES